MARPIRHRLSPKEIELWIPPKTYKRDIFNPLLIPLSLSWNPWPGLLCIVQPGFLSTRRNQNGADDSGFASGAAFEERGALSYLRDGWIVSANSIFGITTPDAAGLKQPNYFNVDWTAAHVFGKWKIGFVGYGAWDVEKTPVDAALGPGHTVAVGGLVGYDFGGPTLSVEATHAIVQGGDTNYGKDDTHVWARLTISIMDFAPAAGRQLVVTK